MQIVQLKNCIMTFAMWDPQGRYGKNEKRAIKAGRNEDCGSLNTTFKIVPTACEGSFYGTLLVWSFYERLKLHLGMEDLRLLQQLRLYCEAIIRRKVLLRWTVMEVVVNLIRLLLLERG